MEVTYNQRPNQGLFANNQTQALPESSLAEWKWWKWPSKDMKHCDGCGAGIYNSCKCAPDELPKEQNKLSPGAQLLKDGFIARADNGWLVETPKKIDDRDVTKTQYPKDSYPDNNPKTAVGAKKLPLENVPPSAMHALAEAFADGAKKYGSYNWRTRTVSSSVYYGAALRHLQAWWDGEEVAEDTLINHLHHAMACLSILIDANSIGKLNDNRPPKGAASKMQKAWVSKDG